MTLPIIGDFMIEMLSFYTEKQIGLGEDAQPISEKLGDDVYLLGVFDGLGGAGGKIFSLLKDFVEVKGAWLASKIIREATLRYFKDSCGNSSKFFNDIPIAVKNLEDKLFSNIKKCNSELELNNPPSRLKGSVFKSLPTTMAVCYISANKGVFIWAGDSRGYILDKDGLHQYTKDDLITAGDALDNSRKTSPMSNFISETGFSLRHHSFSVTNYSIILTATDGCFDFYITPMHFEYIILLKMQEASSFKDWESKLASAITKIAGDDATMSLLCIGWNDFTRM